MTDATAPDGADPQAGPAVERWLRCEHAWVEDRVRDDVALGLAGDRIVAVHAGHDVGSGAGMADSTPVERVAGLVLPGLVDAHSHGFHRVLRGRTHDEDGGSFWTWRERMYAVARVLDPDTYRRLARALFAEQLEAGITTIGEFHYLHHRAGGALYDDPNAMGLALLDAAVEAGIRTTLLDTLYLTGDVDRTLAEPGLSPVQRRFSDRDVDRWGARVAALASAVASNPTAHVGASLHSVRAVPAGVLDEAVAAAGAALGASTADGRRPVLHAHVAEQPVEVERTMRVHGRTPVQLLADAGALGEWFTAVHGVWLDEADIASLAAGPSTVCACPSTERDLADGIVAGDVLHAAGVRLALGSDQHVAADLLAEARALELDRRLATQVRGGLSPSTLLDAATHGGARSLGWADTGVLASGALADLCVVDLGSSRLAGVPRAHLVAGLVHAATAEDVVATMVAGRWVVRDGRHKTLDVAAELRDAIRAVDELVEGAP